MIVILMFKRNNIDSFPIKAFQLVVWLAFAGCAGLLVPRKPALAADTMLHQGALGDRVRVMVTFYQIPETEAWEISMVQGLNLRPV